MTQTVVGIFDSSTEAQNAVERLSENGFTIDQVDLTRNERSSLDNTSHISDHASHEDEGFGEKVSRFFKSLFDDDEESTRYSQVASNAAIVTVITDSLEKAETAARILDDCGAVDVDEKYRTLSDSDSHQQPHAGRGDIDTDVESDLDETGESSRSIPVVEEELHVGKREVERGGVRIRSRIIERPVEEHIRLREERITVERNPVNRPANDSDLRTFREGEIEVKQRAEVPVVKKEARVVEEVRLNRDVTEREEVVRDNVRRTEVDVDKTDDVSNDARLTDRD